jgi:hypothetical protein
MWLPIYPAPPVTNTVIADPINSNGYLVVAYVRDPGKRPA